jgi:GTPase SAR1 family protein
MTAKGPAPFKVVFCGLDNSGKTSFLVVLENKFSLLTNITPTRGIERKEFDVLGHSIIKWDVGGQEKYRENIFKSSNLDQTDLLYYVIDIQDQNRFEESFEYLSKIVQYFKSSNQKLPQFVICLHKMDPDLINDSQIKANIENCENKLRSLMDFSYLSFQTSIYNNWTLRKAFSKGLLQLSPKSSLLDSILTDFLAITQSDTVMLLDKDALVFSECYNDDISYQLTNILAPNLATMADKLMKHGREVEVFEGKIGGWIYFKPLLLDEKTFYIVIFNKHIDSIEEINFALPELTQKIKNVLQTFFI